MPGAVDAWGNDSLGLEGRNAPFHAMGTYYGIGMSTFEPTMGITESQTLFMSSYGNGPGGSTAVVACDLIGMTTVLDLLRERLRSAAADCELQRPLHLRRPVDQPHHEIRHALCLA